MASSGWSAHFAKAFLWSAETRSDWVEVASSAIGLAGPVLLGTTLGHASSGFAASLGGLLIGGMVGGLRGHVSLEVMATTIGPAIAATLVATLLAGDGWPAEALMIVLAGAAALFGGYSRPAATAAARFVPYLIILFSAAATTPNRLGFALLVICGSALTIAAGVLFSALLRAMVHSHQHNEKPASSTATAAQKWARWRRLLRELAGWQYMLRLTLCLALGSVVHLAWPQHHFLWVMLTVALLIDRQIEPLSTRITQRIIGTAFGVAITVLFLFYWPSPAVLMALLALLSAVRPVVRAGNYLAYSAIQTLTIVILLDRGRPPDADLLSDRLIATLIAAGLVIACNALFRRFIKA